MDLEYRPIRDDELAEFFRVNLAAFGQLRTDEQIDQTLAGYRPAFEFDRSVAAFDGDRMVGTAGAFSKRLTVPGHATIAAGGLSFVGVLPTHRRHGILRELMTRHLEDCGERGEAVSILGASESRIYGRFGYGLATRHGQGELETAHSAFRSAVDDPGRARLVTREEAKDVFAAVFDRVAAARPGEVSRSREFWGALFTDYDDHAGDGEGPSLFHLLHEDPDGQADGYLLYRYAKRDWVDGLPRFVVEVHELAATDPTVEAALWRTVLDLDLVETVRVEMLPLDGTLPWLLVDPRRLRTTMVADQLWVRILDVPAVLSARSYASSGSLVLEVSDDVRPEVAGRYRLEVQEGGASCAATGDDPDLALHVDALGAVYLGGTAFSTLAAAGRATALTDGALTRADALFTTTRAPYSTTHF